MKSAAFLDRDGTLIRDERFLADASLMRLLDGAADAVRMLNQAGVLAIVVTNQSGIDRGLITPQQYESTRQRLDELMIANGARLDAQYHCPHAPGIGPDCDCRKPLTGMYRRAAAEHDVDLRRSFYVGDRKRDVEPALTLGGLGALVASPETRPEDAKWAEQQVKILPNLGVAVAEFLDWLKATE